MRVSLVRGPYPVNMAYPTTHRFTTPAKVAPELSFLLAGKIKGEPKAA